MKHLLLLLTLISSVGALSAEELNLKAHNKCKLRIGNDYKDCYLYYSRIKEKSSKRISPSSNSNQTPGITTDLLNYGEPRSDITDKEFLKLHFKLMYDYWLKHAQKRGLSLPIPILRIDDGYLQGCGQKLISKYPNIYCPESNEITLNVRPLIKGLTDKKKLNLNYLSLAILSHEFGHHVNNYIGREKYLKNEENEADWKAGKYLSYAISNKLIPLEGLTKNANLFFSVGDFHLLSQHDNPKNRFNAFMSGFNDSSMGVGKFAGEWLQDTKETFSKRINKSNGIKGGVLFFDVYRFEIERGRQIAGNIVSGVIGFINCSQGTKANCANSIRAQGKAKPEGWFRERKLMINCSSKTFDIQSDGFKIQSISADRKGQAQYLYRKYC
tara:strand:+ start:12708 stop:13859 length:1152 start_codon:yes stop_codon:yes gene_type:complete